MKISRLNMPVIIALIAFFISPILSKASESLSEPNVILLTLDGVRWDEVFKGTDSRRTNQESVPIMKHLLGDLSQEGMLLGDRESSYVVVSNRVKMSLPGYENIFAGFPTRCRTNFCHRTGFETIPERLIREFNFDKMDAAGFASWSKLSLAYEHIFGSTFISAGLSPVELNDPVHDAINIAELSDVPEWNHPKVWTARYDKYTYAHAIHHLKTFLPRFMYISLLDADENAHAGNYPAYVQSVSEYDHYIRELSDLIDSMGEYGKNTVLIVTTDHGRGYKRKTWSSHGPLFPYSKNIWMYVRGRGVKPGYAPPAMDQNYLPVFSHNNIKPTIEKIFGLVPEGYQGGDPLPGITY